MPEHADLGTRISTMRKRRGLTQRELADAAAVSLSLVRKLEQGERAGVRLETAHAIARVLDVPTTRLITGEADPWVPPMPPTTWQPVVDALASTPMQPAEPPTVMGVDGALAGGRALFADEQYDALGAILPSLIRDTRALDDVPQGKRLQYEVMQMCVSYLGQVRQYQAAADAAHRALADAPDELAGGAAVVAQCQQMLRRGLLSEVADLATRWAEELEPRMSRATADELTVWGGLQLRIGAAAVRDNRPREAADALKMARIAAVGLGREVITGPDHLRHFGPATVTQQRAEHAAIQQRPDHVLRLHEAVRTWRPARGGGRSGRYRHLLDVADAHLKLQDEPECTQILLHIHADAPQWLRAQRYAQDIVGRVVAQRRTLTPRMRSLADAIAVPL